MEFERFIENTKKDSIKDAVKVCRDTVVAAVELQVGGHHSTDNFNAGRVIDMVEEILDDIIQGDNNG